MGVAVGEDEAADSLGMAGYRHLGHRAAGVVADQGHVVEIQLVEEAGDDRGDSVGGQVRIRAHRNSLGADRPVGGDAAAAAREAVDDSIPEPPIDQIAVDEDDRRAFARFSVADRPGRKGYFAPLGS